MSLAPAARRPARRLPRTLPAPARRAAIPEEDAAAFTLAARHPLRGPAPAPACPAIPRTGA